MNTGRIGRARADGASLRALRRLGLRASVRIGLARWAALLGPALAMGWAAAGALAVADRLFGLGWSAPMWMLVATPVAAAALAAGAAAIARAPDRLTSLQTVDDSLRLKNALASGVELAGLADADPFASLAVERAARAAQATRLSRAAPIRLNAWWAAWPIVALAAGALAIWTPDVAAQRRARFVRQTAQTQQERAAAQQDVAAAIETAQRSLQTQDETIDDAAALSREEAAAEMERLAQLQRDLAGGGLSPDAARTRAAHSLETLARAADERASDAESSRQALAQRFEGLKKTADENGEAIEPSSAIERLREALAQGDAGQAARALESIQRQLSQADEATRRRLAEELERAAREIEQSDAAPNAAPQTDPADPLKDAGLAKDEAGRLLRESQTQEDMRKALEQRGVDPSTADRIAEEAHDRRTAQAAQRQAEQTADELSRSMQRAAEEARKPQPQEPNKPEEPAPTQQPGDGSKGQRQRESPNATPPSGEAPAKPTPQSSQSPKDESKPTPGKSAAPTSQPDANERAPAQGEGAAPQQREAAPGPAQSAPKPGGEKNDAAPAESQRREAPPAGKSPEAPTGAESSARSDTEREAREPRQGAEPSKDHSDGDGAPPKLPDRLPSAKELERARRLLERMGREQGQSEQQREQAQRLREQARRLLENMSPEERERLERWARSIAQERGENGENGETPSAGGDGAGQTAGATLQRAPREPAEQSREAIVDLRRREQRNERGGRVVGELLREGATQGDGGSATALSRAIEEARQSAERAMEERTIPARRRDAVRRYFDRLRELSRASAPVKPAPTAPDAPDAPKKPGGGSGGSS